MHALSVHLHRRYGSRHLIDLLSTLGFCESYSEALNFETSAVLNTKMDLKSDGFFQFVFDNADFNTRSLDGYNTFHSLGGIICVSPKHSISINDRIPRSEANKVEAVGSFAKIDILTYNKPKLSGVQAIKI